MAWLSVHPSPSTLLNHETHQRRAARSGHDPPRERATRYGSTRHDSPQDALQKTSYWKTYPYSQNHGVSWKMAISLLGSFHFGLIFHGAMIIMGGRPNPKSRPMTPVKRFYEAIWRDGPHFTPFIPGGWGHLVASKNSSTCHHILGCPRKLVNG